MQRVQQITPVTQIQRQPAEVFAQLANGPVVLAKDSQAAAVLVSVEEWNRIADQLARREFTQREIELIALGYQRMNAGGPTITHEELKAQLSERDRDQS